MKTQFSWSRTFTPLHAHVQPGPLPGTAPCRPHPDPSEPPTASGYETGEISKPGHLPSNGRVTSLWCTYLRAGGARRIRNQMSGFPFPTGGTRALDRERPDGG